MTTLGLQPSVGLGFAPVGIVEIPDAFAWIVEGEIAAASSAASTAHDVATDFAFYYGALGACPIAVHHERLTFLPCAGWFVGALVSHGRGFETNETGSAIVTGPWLEARLYLRLVGPIGVSGGLALMVPVSRAQVFFKPRRWTSRCSKHRRSRARPRSR